jgi:hypothetical protein
VSKKFEREVAAALSNANAGSENLAELAAEAESAAAQADDLAAAERARALDMVAAPYAGETHEAPSPRSSRATPEADLAEGAPAASRRPVGRGVGALGRGLPAQSPAASSRCAVPGNDSRPSLAASPSTISL